MIERIDPYIREDDEDRRAWPWPCRLLAWFGVMPVSHYERLVRRERRAARELALATYRLWELFERAPVALAFLDRRGRARHVNTHMRQMLGYAEQQLLSMTFHEYCHPDDVPILSELFQALVEGKRNDYRVKLRCMFNPDRADGRRTDRDGTIYTILHLQRLDSGGDGIVALSMMENVTELHHYQRQLEKSNYDLEQRNETLERIYRNVEMIAFGVVGGEPADELVARLEKDPTDV